MAPQKRYGNKPRAVPLFRLSPFLQNSPHKRTVLGPKDDNAKSSPAQSTRSQKTVAVSDNEVNKLELLVQQLEIDPTPTKPEICKTRLAFAPASQQEYAAPLLCLSLEPAVRPTPFKVWSASLEPFFKIVKIAEASYGEVYRLVLKDGQAPQFTKSDESVLKILALKASDDTGKKKSKAQIARETSMSAVDNVAAEVKLLQRMADIPGFTHFRDIRVLKGKPSSIFAEAWKNFNNNQPEKDKSQFPDPSKRGSYTDQQLWAVIEMQDAGEDLEHLHLPNVFSVWDVFWGVTLALAKGEQEAEFEHRDLHMGNICIKSGKISHPPAITDRVSSIDTLSSIRHPVIDGVVVSDRYQKLGFSGVETTIIDYTLSRAVTAQSGDGGVDVEFFDLSMDKALFEGDATQEYQYEMYRSMRSAISGGNWVDFHPQTNVVWLHFILHEMLNSLHFKWPSEVLSEKELTQSCKADLLPFTKSTNTKGIASQSDNVSHALIDSKGKELESTLKKLQKLLVIEELTNLKVDSATSLVGVALEKGWLDETNVIGEGDTTLASLLG
jgi:serine/threonine-protein kinase haspin